MVEQIVKQASNDFLLKNYAFDIKKQAYILVFQMKCKLFRTVEISEIDKYLSGSTRSDEACDEIRRHLNADGFEVHTDSEGEAKNITCSVDHKFDQ